MSGLVPGSNPGSGTIFLWANLRVCKNLRFSFLPENISKLRKRGGSDISQPPGGVAESWQILESHAITQAKEKVGRGLGSVFQITAGCQSATARASQQNGKVVMSVAVAVSIAAAIDYH